MLKWLTSLLGADTPEKEIARLRPIVDEINRLEDEFRQLSDDGLRGMTAELKERLAGGETLDDILPEAYAAVREASVRTLGKRHYDVQLWPDRPPPGKIAEMRTGEGRWCDAAALPEQPDRGRHLVTRTTTLAGRRRLERPIYRALRRHSRVIAHEFGAYSTPTVDPSSHGDARLDHWRPVPGAGLPGRHNLGDEQRVRLRLPARQHGLGPGPEAGGRCTTRSSTRSTTS